MASVSKFSYQRLRYDYGGLFDQEAEETAFGSLQLGGDRSFGFQAWEGSWKRE